METIYEKENGNAASRVEERKVLDVKPIRTLVPIFPDAMSGVPFVSDATGGKYPPGFTPFYPFNATQRSVCEGYGVGYGNVGFDPASVTPTPIRSYKSPQSMSSIPHHRSNQDTGVSMDSYEENGGDDGFSGKRKERKGMRHFATPRARLVEGLEQALREDGNAETVETVRTMFDALRRRIFQIDEANNRLGGRGYLNASGLLATNGFKTNIRKRIGNVPGVEIGDIFFYRIEMCLVGLHSPPMAGIDYFLEGEGEAEPVAVSIVSSGVYGSDVTNDKDVLIYSGQGGNVNNKQVADQKLVKGNLALENSLRQGNEIRVIRGFPDITSPNAMARIYVYDGLYKVTKSWTESAKSGSRMLKFQLVRSPGQPSAFSVWKSVEKWRGGISSRTGLILPDLTSGAEATPVSLVNDVDNDKGPAYFTYFQSLKYSKPFTSEQSTVICDCQKLCTSGDACCTCLQKNRGEHPYITNGILVCRKPLIYECGSSCKCFSNCKTRVSQHGLKLKLEVFKTTDKGWGLRSWDPIRDGTFICEYAGEAISDSNRRRRKGGENNEYVFDTTRLFDNSLKWNYDPSLLDESIPDKPFDDEKAPDPLYISSKDYGNVSRFMNHSCSPNLFWQPIMYETNGDSNLHIAFFARRNIPPMTELTYDYGISLPVGYDDDGHRTTTDVPRGRYSCLCKSENCWGFYG